MGGMEDYLREGGVYVQWEQRGAQSIPFPPQVFELSLWIFSSGQRGRPRALLGNGGVVGNGEWLGGAQRLVYSWWLIRELLSLDGWTPVRSSFIDSTNINSAFGWSRSFPT